jgi:hypothetical protein
MQHLHNGVVAVEGVAAAAEVVVLPLRRQHVVHPVVQAPAGARAQNWFAQQAAGKR